MIDNPGAPRVRRVARLSQKKVRQQTGLFLVEGPQAVRELLLHRPDLVRELFTTDEQRYAEFDRLADELGLTLERGTPEVLQAMSETVTAQGAVAVAEQFDTAVPQLTDGAALAVILHEVRDPGNAGTVLRAADAAGAEAVIFAGDSIDPFNPKVVRSTTGSLFHLPVIVERSLEAAVQTVREAGMQVIAADVSGDDMTASPNLLGTPTAWLFGNEARGLAAEQLALADAALKVPIFGAAESLNLATAAAVCLYQTAFQQRR